MTEINDLNQKAYALKEHDKEMTQIELDVANNNNITPDDQATYLKRAQDARTKSINLLANPKSKVLADLDFSQKENNLQVKLMGEMYKQAGFRARAEVQDLETQIIEKEGQNLDASDLESARDNLLSAYDAHGVYNPEQAQERDAKFDVRRTKNRLDAMQAQAVSGGDKDAADAFIASLGDLRIAGRPLSADMKADYAKSTLDAVGNIQKRAEAEAKINFSKGALEIGDAFLSGNLDKAIVQSGAISGKIDPELANLVDAALYNPDKWEQVEGKDSLAPSGGGQFYKESLEALDKADKGQINDIVKKAFKDYNSKTIEKKDLAWVLHTANEKMNGGDDNWFVKSMKAAGEFIGNFESAAFFNQMDFKKDPMDQAVAWKKRLLRQSHPFINNLNFTPNGIADAFGFVKRVWDTPIVASKDDNGDPNKE